MSVPRRPQRQLWIGLDAAEWSLVERWAAAGRLPNLRRCIENGTRATLSTPSSQFPDTAWTAVHAGVNPAWCEKYFGLQYDAASQAVVPLGDDAFRSPPFWQRLSAAGLRVGVLDAPKFPLSPELNGFQVANWGACSTETARGATPAPLYAELEERFSRHPVASCDSFPSTVAGHRELLAALLAGARQRGEATRWLMQSRPWDVFFVTFSETHCAGHHFWHYMDETHERHPAGDPHGLAGAIERVYAAVDREIGEILALAGEDAVSVVFSSQGMGPLQHASWNLAEIVELLGFGERPSDSPRPRVAGTNPLHWVKRRIPVPLQLRIKGLLPESLQERIHAFGYTGRRRWKNARAFAVPHTFSVGAIRVSVKGRDRFGQVEPGEPYRAICREIAAALGELRDPASGRSVVQRVTITQEAFAGPHLDRLPDVTVAWDQSFPWTRVESPRLGSLEIGRLEGRSGGHTPAAFAVLNGPGIAANRVLTGHSTYDIAPTALALAGLPPSAELEGRSID